MYTSWSIAPAWAPTVSVVGCTLSLSYQDPDDTDGFVMFTSSGAWRTRKTSYTLPGTQRNGTSFPINSTWWGHVRARQDIVGPASDTVTIGECVH